MHKSTEVVRLELPHRPAASKFAWKVSEVDRLNRRNKISSLPFWVAHDGIARKFQFRLVMVRGIVKGELEDDDPFALFIEYLPPPPEEQQQQCHPDQCNFECTIVNRAAPHRSHVFEGSAVIAPPRTSFGFKSVLAAAELGNEEFVDAAAGMAVEVHVVIEPCVKSVADMLSKTTSSLWASATSALSFVASTVKKAAHAIEAHAHTAEQQQDLDSRVAEREVPWASAPPKWRGREARWVELLTVLLPEDDNTFLIGSDRALTVDQQLLMSQVGLNHRAVMSANSMFDYDADVHEGLLGADALRQKRYELVPRLVDDVTFWRNYLWRVAALSCCATNDQAQVLMSVVNAPLSSAPASPAPAPRTPSAEAPRPDVSQDEVAACVAKTMESVALLQELVADATEDGEMLNAARRSCEAGRNDLERLRARLGADRDTELAVIDKAIADATAALQSPPPAPAQQSPPPAPPPPSPPPAAAAAASPPDFDDFPELDATPSAQKASSPVTATSSAKKAADFALMPWEEEDAEQQ